METMYITDSKQIKKGSKIVDAWNNVWTVTAIDRLNLVYKLECGGVVNHVDYHRVANCKLVKAG